MICAIYVASFAKYSSWISIIYITSMIAFDFLGSFGRCQVELKRRVKRSKSVSRNGWKYLNLVWMTLSLNSILNLKATVEKNAKDKPCMYHVTVSFLNKSELKQNLANTIKPGQIWTNVYFLSFKPCFCKQIFCRKWWHTTL